MRIENPEKLKVPGFLRICDLDEGECFCFADDSNLFMRCDDVMFVSVSSGELFQFDGYGYEDRPVIRVDVRVTIL